MIFKSILNPIDMTDVHERSSAILEFFGRVGMMELDVFIHQGQHLMALKVVLQDHLVDDRFQLMHDVAHLIDLLGHKSIYHV